MNRGLAGTDLSASAVHALLEIEMAGQLTAKDLSDILLLEKSTVSRMLASLTNRGLLRETVAAGDGRIKHLRLSSKGKTAVRGINRYAKKQVSEALSPLDPAERYTVLSGLQIYSHALKFGAFKSHHRSGTPSIPEGRITIGQGHVPGLVGRVVEMHAAYYARIVGFGATFEAKVASEIAEFVTRIDKPQNAIWHASCAGKIAGSISIDGEGLGKGTAHLRWFIVDDQLQGVGLGNALIQRALNFCDERSFSCTRLWTFKGLDAAKRLYERHGFELTGEKFGRQWGAEVLEQEFVRPQGP